MSEIDDRIRDTLRAEDAEILAPFRGEPPVHELLIELLRGRNRWLNALAFVFALVGLAAAVVAAYQFFHTDDTRAMIAWATCFLWFVIWIAMLKIWFWMEMQKHSITREIKRLELQVANLGRQLGDRT